MDIFTIIKILTNKRFLDYNILLSVDNNVKLLNCIRIDDDNKNIILSDDTTNYKGFVFKDYNCEENYSRMQ